MDQERRGSTHDGLGSGEPTTVGTPAAGEGTVSLAACDEAVPIPPRFWWLKRILIGSGCLVLGLVALRLWWGWYADRLLQAEIDRIIAAGEPIFPEDFNPKEPIPDDQNAVTLIEKAIDAFVGTTTSGVSVDDFLHKPELFETDPKSAGELIEQNAAVLTLIRKSRGMQAHWPKAIRNSPSMAGSGIFSMHRALAKLLFLKAETEFRTDDHAAAIETLHDLYWHAHVLNSQPTVISNLVGWATAGLGNGFVQEHGAVLRINGNEDRNQNGSPAEREQVTSLVSFLLDDDLTRNEVIRAEWGERAEAVELLKAIDAQGSPAAMTRLVGRRSLWERVIYWPRRPLYVLDTVRSMRAKWDALNALHEDTWPSAVVSLATSDDTPAFILRLARPVTFDEWGNDLVREARFFHSYYRFLAQRHMAAIALGLRLYVIGHGRRPSTLAELGPDQFPAVPIDPFSADGSQIRYRTTPLPQILYSVWEDGVDNGGTPRTRTRPDGHWEIEGSDLIFYLDGSPKDDDSTQRPASTQAGDDNDDAQHDQRQDDHADKPKS